MTEESQAQHLIDLIAAGQKIAAIKLLREADGLSLKDAKERVEQLTAELKAAGKIPAGSQKSGCGALILLSVLPFVALVVYVALS